MILDETPPPHWDSRIAFPLQSVGFAEASRALGHRPFFAENALGQALVLVRRAPLGVFSGWTARAKVYAHARHPGFWDALVARLRTLGVSHIKLGDAAWGLERRRARHMGVAAPRRLACLRARTGGGRGCTARRHPTDHPAHIRKAADAVTVSEVRTPDDVRDYVTLAAETGTRMRGRDVAAVYPASYFEAVWRGMVAWRQAVMFVARAGDAPRAAAAFVMNADRFTQIHGCSSRDRRLTPKQGPTALFWHAMRHARARNCRTFDMGAVTPTDDARHPHHSVYAYKKRWGGRLEQLRSAEFVACAWKHRFQERILAPMWDRVHPVYLRVFGDDATEAPHEAPVARSSLK